MKKRQKRTFVRVGISTTLLRRLDQYAASEIFGEEGTSRASAIIFLIETGLHDQEMTDRRRAALQKSRPSRVANTRAAYTKEAYRVEVLGLGASSNNGCSAGQRFADLEQAREHYDSLEVPKGMRKELQRRLPGKMRYEAIEIEVGR